MFQLVVFDIDGTLIDSEQTGVRSLMQTIRELTGREVPYEEAYRWFGISSADVARDLHYADAARFGIRWEENYVALSHLIKPFPGALEMVARIKAAGFRTGIVTARNRFEFDNDPRLKPFLPYIDHVVSADDTPLHKPDPAPMRHIVALASAASAAAARASHATEASPTSPATAASAVAASAAAASPADPATPASAVAASAAGAIPSDSPQITPAEVFPHITSASDDPSFPSPVTSAEGIPFTAPIASSEHITSAASAIPSGPSQITPAETVYFGDTVYDCRCAQGAGCRFALADWRSRGLQGIPADFRFTSAAEALQILGI